MNGVQSAKNLGLVGCQRCSRVWPSGVARCGRCGAKLRSRAKSSLLKVWVFWGLGILAYIPANLLPMLETRLFFRTSDDTIIEGALKLFAHGSIGIALVILIASVGIPIAKFTAIAWLALTVQHRMSSTPKWRHRVFEAVELIGRWSMIDVFVVAILASLVQFSVLASVRPGGAALAFALSVIFTMLSAHSFDSRMIWDMDDETASAGKRNNLAAVEQSAPPKR